MLVIYQNIQGTTGSVSVPKQRRSVAQETRSPSNGELDPSPRGTSTPWSLVFCRSSRDQTGGGCGRWEGVGRGFGVDVSLGRVSFVLRSAAAVSTGVRSPVRAAVSGLRGCFHGAEYIGLVSETAKAEL